MEISSNGISAGSMPSSPDIEMALSQGTMSYWEGRNPATGERIMAVRASMASLIGVVRMMISDPSGSSPVFTDQQIFELK